MNRSIAILLLGLSLAGCVEARSVVPADGPGPLLVAHRAGTADYPENTLLAIRKALDNGADALWLSVQLSADGHPVLYRPADLAVLTQGAGAVGQSSLAELARLNAGYMFKAEDGSYPYRQKPLRIPTLRQALRAIPPQVPVFLDMKSLPVEPLVDAVAGELERQKAWSRVRFYSTEKAANDYLAQRYADRARQFESRDATRNRLVGLAFGERCEAPPAGGTWMGIELRRELTVTERFTLGESSYKVPAAPVVDAQSDGLRAPRAGEGGDVRHRDRRGLPHRARPGRRRGDEQLAQEDGGDPPPGARRSARRVARQRPFHRFAQGLGLFADGVAGVELGAVAPHRLAAAGVVQLDADHGDLHGVAAGHRVAGAIAVPGIAPAAVVAVVAAVVVGDLAGAQFVAQERADLQVGRAARPRRAQAALVELLADGVAQLVVVQALGKAADPGGGPAPATVAGVVARRRRIGAGIEAGIGRGGGLRRVGQELAR